MKGPTWLSVVPDFDTIDGVSIDYMHAVLLRVCRLLLQLWLHHVIIMSYVTLETNHHY